MQVPRFAVGRLLVVGFLGLGGCTREPWAPPEVPESRPNNTAKEVQSSSGATDWSYQGPRGPEHWASLEPAWSACESPGQSPVDLPLDALTEKTPEDTPLPAELEFLHEQELSPQFAALPLELSSHGRRLILSGAASQGLSIGGRLAQLDSIAIHRPAEHLLGGAALDLELVLWLHDPKGGRLALSLLFRKGNANAPLDSLIQKLPPPGVYEHRLLGGTIALPQLFPAEAKLLAYVGSESTPPCAPKVPRLILAHVLELSEQQLHALAVSAPNDSRRPTQSLGDRVVRALTLSAAHPAQPAAGVEASAETGASSSSPAAPAPKPPSISRSTPVTKP